MKDTDDAAGATLGADESSGAGNPLVDAGSAAPGQQAAQALHLWPEEGASASYAGAPSAWSLPTWASE